MSNSIFSRERKGICENFICRDREFFVENDSPFAFLI
jgi:hypothetical protein